MRSVLTALLGVALLLSAVACQPDQIPPIPTPMASTPVSVAGKQASATATPSPVPTSTPLPSPTPTPTEVPVVAPVKHPSVGIVLDVDYEARARLVGESAQATARDSGLELALVPSQPGDVARNATRLANAGHDVVIVSAYNPPLGVWLAQRYPQTRFVVFGELPDPAPANLTGLDFAEDEAGFLAGALAGWLTQKDMVAFVGTQPTADIVKYRKGYEHGVRYVNSKAVVLGAYLDSAASPQKGAAEARAQLDEGADILFAVGGATARGALEAGAARGVAVIAAEVDPYASTRSLGPALASTAIVHLERGIADIVRAVKAGTLKGGTLVYDVKNGAVELGPYHEWESRVPEAAKVQLREIFAGLQKGTIKTMVEIPQY